MGHIYQAMNKAMQEICRLGIGKSRKADAGPAKYNFRGIEDAMNEMSPILVRNGIICLPRFTELSIVERIKGSPAEGKATRFATVKGIFTFVSMEDGSTAVAEAYGEAADSGDKALTKAQSVSLRTALFDTFMVPTMAMDPEADYYEAPQEPESLDKARDAALGGTAAFRDWWKGQPATVRTELGKYMSELQQAATAADGAQK